MSWVGISLVLLAAGAVASLAFAKRPSAALVVSMTSLFIAGLVLVCGALRVLFGAQSLDSTTLDWPLPLGHVSVAVDALSAWFLMTMGFLAVCVAPYSVAYMRPFEGKEPVHRFGALMCTLLASLVVFVSATDMVAFLFAWESMTLSAFFLVMFHDAKPEVRRGAWMYLIATHLATALCLAPLLGLILGATHSTEFASIAPALKTANKSLQTVLFLLGAVGFGAKAGFYPMHIWLPAAHPVAPTPVSAFLSGVVVKVGVYGLLRLLTWLPPMPNYCAGILLVIGIASGVMGVLYALVQHNLKRLLAYHTVENIGIIAIAIAVGMLGRANNLPAVAALGFVGALLHVTNHALFKGLLFLSAGTVLHGSGSVAIERLGGLAKKTPVNTFLFLVGAIAICGLPPLNGFVSEWAIYAGLFTGAGQGTGVATGAHALGVFALALMGSLALACFAKVFGVVFLGAARDPRTSTHSTPLLMKLSMAALALMCAFIGLAPRAWVPLAYGATGLLAGADSGHVAMSIDGVLGAATNVSRMAVVLILLAAGLALLRALLGRRAIAPPHASTSLPMGTWGCGYAYPQPHMQYTATSFALPLIRAFRALLWPEYSYIAPGGAFPSQSYAAMHAHDLAEQDVFAPILRWTVRLFAMYRTLTWSGVAPDETATRPVAGHRNPLKSLFTSAAGALRKGSIQIYLSFIVITLILLFLIEGFTTHRPPTPSQTHAPGVAADTGNEK